jgi:hypothetical protein
MPQGSKFYANLVCEFPAVEGVQASQRRERFKRLNEILENIARKKAKKEPTDIFDFSSTACSSVQWKDIENIYSSTTEFYTQPEQKVSDQEFDIVYNYLQIALKCFGNIITGKDAKRLYFIAPILLFVCSQFDNIEILVDEDVEGMHIENVEIINMQDMRMRIVILLDLRIL